MGRLNPVTSNAKGGGLALAGSILNVLVESPEPDAAARGLEALARANGLRNILISERSLDFLFGALTKLEANSTALQPHPQDLERIFDQYNQLIRDPSVTALSERNRHSMFVLLVRYLRNCSDSADSNIVRLRKKFEKLANELKEDRSFLLSPQLLISRQFEL